MNLSKQVSQEIKDFIKNYNKLLIMGIGNFMRGDDGAGPAIIDQLYEKIDKSKENIYLLSCQTTPENYTQDIKKVKPSHLIIIDAVKADCNSGEVMILDKSNIDTYGISTHSMPVSFLINYLEKSIDLDILIIGIQPEQMDFTTKLSPDVEKSIDKLSSFIAEIV